MKIIVIISVLALCVSCGGSSSRSSEETISEPQIETEDIISEFQIEVELSNDCVQSSECQVVYPKCPLATCGIAVNSSHIEQLKGIEDKLYKKIEAVNGQCDSLPGCLATTAECKDNKCQQVSVDEN